MMSLWHKKLTCCILSGVCLHNEGFQPLDLLLQALDSDLTLLLLHLNEMLQHTATCYLSVPYMR